VKTQDELEQRLERFYEAVQGEVPTTPPAWFPGRPARKSRLQPVLAAAAVAIFFVGLVVGFRQLNLARSAPAGSSHPSAPQAPALSMGVARPDGMWMVVRTIDTTPPSAGGVPRPEQNVLEVTTDGGRSWQPRLTFAGIYDGMSWSTDGRQSVVWAIEQTANGCTNTAGAISCPEPSRALTVFVSADGGRTWNARMPTAWPAQYVYFRGIEGWALSRGIRQGLGPDDLYHTADGAQTWTKVGTMAYSGERMSSISGAGEYALEFVSTQVGWFATGETAKPGKSGLYLTTDGGRSWTSQSVQPPPGLARHPMTLGYPQILDDKHLLLPVVIGPLVDPNSPGTGDHYLYSSSDGGLTWTNPVVLRAGAVKPMGSEYMQFYLDATHWWFTSNNDHPADSPEPKPQSMARTRDGGKTWQVSATDAIFSLRFSDPNNGWAEAEAKVGSDYINILLRTTDGGAHWQRVPIP
jgi:hypothetical protein